MVQKDLSHSESGASGVSRRQFLKRGGLLAGAALFIGAGLPACAPAAEQKPAGTPAVSGDKTLSYSVYDADILVIGTGFAGMNAALAANTKGANVLMVDKGPFEFSGGTGMNWDQEIYWPNETPPDGAHCMLNGGIANQKFVQKAYEFLNKDYESWHTPLWWLNMGSAVFSRLPDGNLEKLALAGTPINMVQRCFSRHLQDTLKTQPITIVDNTMITNLFINDGTCVGAIGYHINTGEYRVFRAKATVDAAGPCCQMTGWLDVNPISQNTPDNTGDIQAAALRHGASLISNEFFGVDCISVAIPALGAGLNANIGIDGDHMTYACNKDGEFFLRDHEDYDISREVRDQVLAGKGGPHGGVYIDLTDPEALDPTKFRPVYLRNVYLWKEKFGLDVTQPGYKIPVCIEAFEHGTGILLDENAATSIPGLYGQRGFGRGGSGINAHCFSGAYAGHNAAEYAVSASLSNVDWSAAETEIARIDEIRTREVNDGIRPFEIRHNIQHTFYDNWEPATDATKLQTAIDEIERIKNEDLPKQYVADKSSTFNRDWKDAVENYNIVDLTEATLRAALMREESRSFFYRTDFPEQDDENWKANIATTLKNGKMEVEKLPQVTL